MNPIDGQPLLLAAAKASVGGERLAPLVEAVQSYLGPQLDDYRRRYETAHETDERVAFFVPEDHWADLGEQFDFAQREWDAVRRAHEEQLLFDGRDADRREEFDTALEVRGVVVIGRGSR